MSLPPPPKFPLKESTPTLMTLSSKEKDTGLKANLKMLQKKDYKKLKLLKSPLKNGEPLPRPLKRPLMPSFWKTSRKSKV